MKNALGLILFFTLLNFNNIHSQNAPVSTVGAIFSYEATAIVSITATGINNVGSTNMQLLYDPDVATCTSVTKGPQLPGGLAINLTVPGIITIGWYTWPGVTLPDNSVIFNLSFTRMAYGNSPITWSETYGDRQWSDGNSVVLNDLPFDDYYINGSLNFLSENNTSLTITMFLEGAFDNGEMSTILNDNNYLPTSQPYDSDPWNYNGGESVVSFPENTVDWVLIELRETTGDASTATPDKMIARRAAFLLKDGSIKDMDGTSNLNFPVSITQNLFILAYHRNHIAVISANPIAIASGSGNINFSSGEFQVLGGNNGHKELTTGIWGLAAGDSNADGIIDDSDKIDDWKPNAGTTGYKASDFSFDTQINNTDKNEYWNLNYLFETQVPEQ